MRDLRTSGWIWTKGWLLLLLSLFSGWLLLARTHDIQDGALLVICVWSATRFYYFTFYVIEKYVDATYRFDGLYAFIGYLLKKK